MDADHPRGQAPPNLGSIELRAPSREVSTQQAVVSIYSWFVRASYAAFSEFRGDILAW